MLLNANVTKMRKSMFVALLLCLATAQAEEPKKVVRLHGFLQTQGETGDRLDSRFTDDNDRIFLRRARLGVSGDVMENVDFRLELDLAGSLASVTGLRAQMTDGFINWRATPSLTVRAGQFKTPFGVEFLTSDTRLLTPERSLATDRLTQGRQVGIQASGDLLGKKLSYALGAFNGTSANSSGNDDDGFMTAGRLSGLVFRTEATGISLGASAFSSADRAIAVAPDFGIRSNLFAGTRQGFAIDSQWEQGRFEAAAEVLHTKFEGDNVAAFNSTGWFGQAAWFITPKKLQVVLRGEGFDPNNGRFSDDTRTWGAGANYLFKGHDLKVQLHYLHSETAGEPAGRVIVRLQAMF